MIVENAVKLLEKQQKNLKTLLKITENKQLALVGTLDMKLDELIAKEEKILLTVNEAEKERRDSVEDILMHDGKEVNSARLPKMSELLKEKISSEELERIEAIEADMRETAAKIKKTNERNLFLIKHMRQFVNETMMTLFGSRQRSFIDRKA